MEELIWAPERLLILPLMITKEWEGKFKDKKD